MNMGGGLGPALVVFVCSLCSFLIAGLGSTIFRPANIAVANNSVIYMSSVAGNVSLRIGCLPEDRMPSIPEPYRNPRLTAQPEPILSLLGDWAGSARDGLEARFGEHSDEDEVQVDFVLDGSHRASSTWVLHRVRTSVGGYSLSVRGRVAADLLTDIVASKSLVMEIDVFDELILVAFHLDGLEQAVARAIACLH